MFTKSKIDTEFFFMFQAAVDFVKKIEKSHGFSSFSFMNKRISSVSNRELVY